MIYKYQRSEYAHSMAMNPSKVEEGQLELANRPLIGEQVMIGKEWVTIQTIRHTPDGMVLVLAAKRQM